MKQVILFLGCLMAAMYHLTTAASVAQSPRARVEFVRDIEPILKQSCYACHGPDKTKGQLRLDSKSLALKGGVSGVVIIPGNSKESLLVHRLRGDGSGPRMPAGGDPLTPEQMALISDWIDQGAVWPDQATASDAKIERHWAYVKPERPRLPAVKNSSWVRNPVDNFVLARLEREGLLPSPEASKETLIRRLSLDLTGLPPSVKEVDTFLADKSHDAYEKVVDRMLASHHYGERWARPWLDIARYADTNGYEKDRRRSNWKYRDWVIDALNRDMPFDQFTIEQLAGDMLAGATVDQKIATGFHRNTMLNEEGGVDQEQYLWETLVDRVNTTATAWLGSTLACAQCHNHKYDPFTQKEYYQFLAFFSNTEYRLEGDARVSEQKLSEERLELPTPEQSARRREIQAEINRLDESLRTSTPEMEAAQADWERSVTASSSDWVQLDLLTLSSSGGSVLLKSEDGSVVVTGANPEKDLYTITAKTDLKKITGLRLEALADARLPRGGPGRDIDGNFFVTGFEVEQAPADNPTAFERVTFTNAVADDALRGSSYDVKNLIRARLAYQGWAIDATKDAARLARQAVFVPKEPAGFEQGTVLTIRIKHELDNIPRGLGRFRLWVTQAQEPLSIVNVSATVRPLLEIAPADRAFRQKQALAEYYRSIAPVLKPARDRIAELKQSIDRLEIVTTLVMKERPLTERPSTHLRLRGSYTSKGELVYAGVPAVLHPFPESQLATRLGLARWLVDANNPLTARVTVNRFWEQFFGRGLVETSEDFGAQGERPTHPELLDWLATEFMQRGWSMKAMHRLIVTSATYRQASRVTPRLLERDPYNKLLARGPRFRMEAEMIRDVALAASGQLSRKIGGPSVFPPQPEGIWDSPYNDEKWTPSEGDDRYRRALYTFMKRTSPYPSLLTFDAPSREYCTVRRVRTNTPLQSLTTLNDPAFFDAAKSLARRIITEGGGRTEARLVHGFRLCTSRRPGPEELDRLARLYREQLDYFMANPEQAGRVMKGSTAVPAEISDAELAAWTIVSNVLLNLDEALTKE